MNGIIQIEMVYIFRMRMKRNRISHCTTFEWQWMNTSFWHNHILKWKCALVPAYHLIKSLEFRFRESKRICVCYLYFEFLFSDANKKSMKTEINCVIQRSVQIHWQLWWRHTIHEILLPNIDIISFVQFSNYTRI